MTTHCQMTADSVTATTALSINVDSVEARAGEADQRDREHRVREQVEDVGVRVAVGASEAAQGDVERDVAGRVQREPEGEELPHAAPTGFVAQHAVDGGARRAERKGVEDERTGVVGREARARRGQRDADREEAPDDAVGETACPGSSAAPSVVTGPTGPTPAMDGRRLPGFTLRGQMSHEGEIL